MAYLVVSQMFELHFPLKLRGSYNFHQIQASQLGLSATLCQNVASGRLMDDKMAVMLGRNPLNWDSFCRAWGRSNMDGVQRGVFRRDSIKDFASRPCWHRRAPRAIVWKTWLSIATGKSSRFTFSSWRWRIWSSPKCSNCISHWNYAARTTFTKSRPVN